MSDTIRRTNCHVERLQPKLAQSYKRGHHVQSSLHSDVRVGGTGTRFTDESGNLAGRRGRRSLKRQTAKKARRFPIDY